MTILKDGVWTVMVSEWILFKPSQTIPSETIPPVPHLTMGVREGNNFTTRLKFREKEDFFKQLLHFKHLNKLQDVNLLYFVNFLLEF